MSAQDNVELWESGPIHAAFPIKVGTMTYTEIQGHCAFCNQLIQPDYFRGKVTRVLPEVVEVRAVGICTDCQKASLFHYRLESDATFSGKNQDGKWARWSMKPEHQKTPAWTSPSVPVLLFKIDSSIFYIEGHAQKSFIRQ